PPRSPVTALRCPEHVPRPSRTLPKSAGTTMGSSSRRQSSARLWMMRAMSGASRAMSGRGATAAAPSLGPRRQARSTRSQCAELAGKPPAQAGHGQARKGTGSDPRQASRSSMPVPGFRSCTMQKKRFVGPITLPSYAIPLTVLIRNEPCNIADRLPKALPLCLKLSLQIVGASGERRIGGNIRVPFREQLCESLLNTSSCRLFTEIWSVLSLRGTHAEQCGDGRRSHLGHTVTPQVQGRRWGGMGRFPERADALFVESDRDVLLCSCRMRGVELPVALLDAAGPLVPGDCDADMVRADPLACGGDFLLCLARCQGEYPIPEAWRAAV